MAKKMKKKNGQMTANLNVIVNLPELTFIKMINKNV
ncbi:GSCOCG00000084001-RA-CDS [Cotesia congregata]|nr:GSCOCG00000084001-RA-CDS [Cotesia congregata]